MIDERFYHYHGKLSISDIARFLNLGLESNYSEVIHIIGVANLAVCSANTLSFYNGKKYKDALETAQGGIVLCRADDASTIIDAGCIALVTPNPRVAFSKILDKMYSKRGFVAGDVRISPDASIHKTAHIMPGAVIGPKAIISDNAIIGPNAVIGPGVTIGKNTNIGSCAQIMCADIGDRCTIHGGGVIGGDGFGVAQDDKGNIDIAHIGTVLIADDVTIGCNTAIDRGMLGATSIGNRTKIDNLCQIGHNTQIGDDCVIAAHAGISGSCIIGNGVSFGGAVGIADHMKIGDGAVLAGRAGVMKNVPDGEVWSGFPAKPLRQHMREVATLSRITRSKKK